MSWRVIDLEKQKINFISDWSNQKFYFVELCRRYQISRKTGYKLINRFNKEGAMGLKEKSCARHHHPNEIRDEIKREIINLKQRYPTWGPVKLIAKLKSSRGLVSLATG